MTAPTFTIRKIGLITKAGYEKARIASEEIAQWLTLRNALAFVTNHKESSRDINALPSTDLILTIGGDGTIISVARQFIGTNIPIAGVNFGKVGFLAEIEQNNWQVALEHILSRPIIASPRMTLQYTLHRNGQIVAQGEAINDAVFTRGNLARLVRLQLSIQNSPFFTLRADGIIVSTPTGSTGYTGSAGGPLIHPSLNCYGITAICPFLSTFPPLVLPAETPFSIVVCDGGAELYLTLDGQDMVQLNIGDEITLQGQPARVILADLRREPYVNSLCEAGFIRQNSRG